ncbi:MAG TPA: threonine dehydratase [Anaerolineae bacterium]|nr:threonine dehydratase [Anaerolineae bacterium]
MLTLHDIIAARPHVYRFLHPTPLHHYAGLSQLTGAQVWVKHENHQPVGAFKVRGGLNYVAGLSAAQRQAGLYTASTGNHGQSIAFAARAFGVCATVAMPEQANPDKVAAMRGLGAEVVFHGPDFDTAREWMMQVAAERGGVFVGPTDEPLICGVGTYGLEILEDLPDVDVIIVPVGAGSGACGTGIVAKAINPRIQVIGVQSAQAPAMQRSWASGQLTTAEMRTFAEGIATRVPFENTQLIMRHVVDDFVLVDDADIQRAILLLLEHTHNLAEGAGAAPLAAALQIKERLAGKKVVLVLSGGNLAVATLLRTLLDHS